MLKKERHKLITDIVAHKKSVTVGELARATFVSEATVRRDLAELAKAGALGRTHGGAFVTEGGAAENPAMVRERQRVREKRAIAELARDFLGNESTLFMDSSSTAGMLIPFFREVGGISVITNGVRNCIRIMESCDARVYLCPGVVSRYSDAVLGTDAVAYISRFRADLCVISCGGLSADGGITEASPEQSDIKREMLKNSAVKILLCDKSKFEKTFMSEICDFDGIDYLLCDSIPDGELLTAIRDAGCEVISAGADSI